MKLTKTFSALALLAVATVSTAFAETKVSLISVSPGPSFFEAFGHTGVLVEDTKTKASDVYEYSGIDLSQLKNDKVISNAIALLKGTSKTTVLKTPLKDFLSRYQDQGKDGIYRVVSADPMDLTVKETDALVDALGKDAATGKYDYDILKRNCTTMVRDDLFAVRDPKEKTVLGTFYAIDSKKQRLTYKQILMNAIDEAAKVSPDGTVEFPVGLFAPDAQMGLVMKVFLDAAGIPVKMESGEDFRTALNEINKLLKETAEDKSSLIAMTKTSNPKDPNNKYRYDASEIARFPELAKVFNEFVTVTLEKEPTEYEAAFIAKRLQTIQTILNHNKASQVLVKSMEKPIVTKKEKKKKKKTK